MNDERSLVFQTALEQAQQQFTAAQSVGYESRPLNLFYGISQAGRAIAAASPRLGIGGSLSTALWSAKGHGLIFNPDLSAGVDLLSATVDVTKASASKPHSDLYSRVSLALNSPLDFGPLPLVQILSQLPEYRFEFEEDNSWLPELHDATIFVHYPHSGDLLKLELKLPGIVPSDDLQASDVTNAASHYPALKGFAVSLNADGSVLTTNSPPRVNLGVPREQLRLSADGNFYIPKGAVPYRRNELIFPKMGTSEEALHPLMSWWLVLYSLSMIARYSPAHWTDALSISSSAISSKVEHVLDVALEAVPELVAEALSRPV